MFQFSFLLIMLILAFAAAVIVVMKRRSKTRVKGLPESYKGAIRFTDGQGRDMLIVRKEDGSFEMQEERKARGQRDS